MKPDTRSSTCGMSIGELRLEISGGCEGAGTCAYVGRLGELAMPAKGHRVTIFGGFRFSADTGNGYLKKRGLTWSMASPLSVMRRLVTFASGIRTDAWTAKQSQMQTWVQVVVADLVKPSLRETLFRRHRA